MRSVVDVSPAVLVRDRRRAPDLEHPTDVLSRLIRVDDGGDRLTDAELRDQMVTLLLAGHETTASAGAGVWLEAALKESLRLHPVIPMVVRVLKRPTAVGGVDLPDGTVVAASVLLAHARPKAHPEPDEFRPERFVGGAPAPPRGPRDAARPQHHQRSPAGCAHVR